MFPLSIEGSVSANARTEADVRALCERICAEIRPLGFDGVIRGAVVSFVGSNKPFWRPFAVDRSMETVDAGEFHIGDDSIRYRLSTMYFAVIVSTVLSLPLVFCLVLRSLVGVAGVLGFWSLAVVVSYLLVVVRVRRALHRAAMPFSQFRG